MIKYLNICERLDKMANILTINFIGSTCFTILFCKIRKQKFLTIFIDKYFPVYCIGLLFGNYIIIKKNSNHINI